ncbi:hypothetical protein [Leptolyngbya ohadii]|uniref:hypothetical protein n=1 Tax=Leptolyngbya ohadii TaxID=1962290 RepID=UPI000B59BE6E|nr:hypothetical protein [Leptolyngbya ohadii]
MPEFIPTQSITTEEPNIEVTIGANNPLKVGRHVFQLIVVDDAGNESLPDRQEVFVLDTELPTARLEIQPSRVQFGKSFALSGERSVDLGGGRIVKYIWTLVE